MSTTDEQRSGAAREKAKRVAATLKGKLTTLYGQGDELAKQRATVSAAQQHITKVNEAFSRYRDAYNVHLGILRDAAPVEDQDKAIQRYQVEVMQYNSYIERFTHAIQKASASTPTSPTTKLDVVAPKPTSVGRSPAGRRVVDLDSLGGSAVGSTHSKREQYRAEQREARRKQALLEQAAAQLKKKHELQRVQQEAEQAAEQQRVQDELDRAKLEKQLLDEAAAEDDSEGSEMSGDSSGTSTSDTTGEQVAGQAVINSLSIDERVTENNLSAKIKRASQAAITTLSQAERVTESNPGVIICNPTESGRGAISAHINTENLGVVPGGGDAGVAVYAAQPRPKTELQFTPDPVEEALIGRRQKKGKPHPIHASQGFPVQTKADPMQTLATLLMGGMTLPRPDIITFDGDITKYHAFLHSFKSNVESKVLDDESRLNYLIQYCSGAPKDLIEPCAMGETVDYQRARQLLHEEYGQTHLVAEAFTKKLAHGPALKPNDAKALKSLAADIVRADTSLSQLQCRSVVDNSEILRAIADRLPQYCRREWGKTASRIQYDGGRMPALKDLTKFIKEQSQLANSAYMLHLNTTSSGKSEKTTKLATTYATSGEQEPASQVTAAKRDIQCQCCRGPCKKIEECEQFKAANPEERRRTLMAARLCFNCFKVGHVVQVCRAASTCSIPGCNNERFKHHTLLHEWIPKKRVTDTAAEETAAINTMVTKSNAVCLRLLPVLVSYGSNRAATYALLDNGSDTTLVDQTLVKQLKIPDKPRSFKVKTIHGVKEVKGAEVNLMVQSLDGEQQLNMQSVWVVPNLELSSASIPTASDVENWPHLKDVKLQSLPCREVGLLIGCDQPRAFWTEDERRGQPSEPYAVKSILGWSVLGPLSSTERLMHARINHTNFNEGDVEEHLARLWSTDFGFDPGHTTAMSQEDRLAMKILEDTVTFEDGHYTMGLPWRSRATTRLPPSRRMAEMRLNSLAKKFKRDPDYRDMYALQVNNYIVKGYARELTEEELLNPSEPRLIWYLPHHGVINVNKPGKVRVVFDCAARCSGTCLNDELLQGPDLVTGLLAVLIRFRQSPIALTSDIEAMFNQVRVSIEDTDAMRFLWWKDMDMTAPPSVYKMTVQLFGARSSPTCCTYALKKTATDNSCHYQSSTLKTIERNIYVDDLLKSVETKEEATALVAETTSLLAKGGFRLTKWTSNCPEVLSTLESEEMSSTAISLGEGNDSTDRALGVSWRLASDTLCFKLKNQTRPMTRRGVLSLVAGLYDPIGLVAPVTLAPKRLMQSLCKQKLSWDEDITDEDATTWSTWCAELPALELLRVPRCYRPTGFITDRAELHAFSDASTIGYGACVYLRQTDATGISTVQLVIGKSRLAPIKEVTVPRLELAAAVVATTLAHVAATELEIHIDHTWYWTDSTVVLAYINNTTTRYKTFVANRLATIHERTHPEQWRHVPTDFNPADLASRGLKATDNEGLKFWLEGPTFLQQSCEQWPPVDPNIPVLVEGMEVKNTNHITVSAVLLDELAARYSDWTKLRRATAILTRFHYYILRRMRKEWTEEPERGQLTLLEVERAGKLLVQRAQVTHFGEELDCLASGRAIKTTSQLATLCPAMSNGLLVLRGRIAKEEPLIILPQKCDVTRLLVQHIHRANGHVGPKHMLALVRHTYWIIRGLQACKSVTSRCIGCKKQHARPLEQKMAPLPEERLTPDKPPFSYVGTDYFGPFFVKVGRAKAKRWGVVFTCLTTRAIHLEIAHRLDTDSFLGAVTRFIARRGRPLKMYSDNGTNLAAGAKELATMVTAWNQDRLHRDFLQREIEWHFTPPHASHMGGVYERMIRSVRNILNALATEQVLTDECLLTLFAESERIVNSRPITSSSTTAEDIEPLTPAKLLLLENNGSMPPATFSHDDLYCRRWWRQAQYLANIFWQRWIREYLPSLQPREKWQRPRTNLRINDLVMIVDGNQPRGRWPLAIVTGVKLSSDGLVRACTVRTANGHEYSRPICKLCLLEQSA